MWSQSSTDCSTLTGTLTGACHFYTCITILESNSEYPPCSSSSDRFLSPRYSFYPPLTWYKTPKDGPQWLSMYWCAIGRQVDVAHSVSFRPWAWAQRRWQLSPLAMNHRAYQEKHREVGKFRSKALSIRFLSSHSPSLRLFETLWGTIEPISTTMKTSTINHSFTATSYGCQDPMSCEAGLHWASPCWRSGDLEPGEPMYSDNSLITVWSLNLCLRKWWIIHYSCVVRVK